MAARSRDRGRVSSFLRDVASADAAAVAGGASATQRGAAVAQVISRWLAIAPYDMLQELLDQPESSCRSSRRPSGR